MRIKKLEEELYPLKEKLINHTLYNKINSQKSIQIFMEGHVYAVWDFMSFVKKIQQLLTCTKTPWIPSINPIAARLINNIVLGEEAD